MNTSFGCTSNKNAVQGMGMVGCNDNSAFLGDFFSPFNLGGKQNSEKSVKNGANKYVK
jgi:hypothetical protein